MSLVAYDSGSDNSNAEDEEDQKMEVDNFQSRVTANSEGRNDLPSQSATAGSTSALKFDSVLPKPKYTAKQPQEIDPVPPKKIYGDEESMPKPPGPSTLQSSFSKLPKAGGKVRITIPSLKDFENDEADDKDKKKIFQPSKKGSGLFALLPEPKLDSYMPKAKASGALPSASISKSNLASPMSVTTTTSTTSKASMPLVPQQTLKRPLSPTSANKRLAQVRAKYMKQEIDCIKIVSRKDKKPEESVQVVKSRGEDSDEEDDTADFFSLDASGQDADEGIPMDTDRVPSPVFFSDRLNGPAEPTEEERLPSASFTDQPIQQAEDDIMKYIHDPKKARRGGTSAPVKIIDINADDLRPQSTEWLKAISDTSMIPPRKVNLPGGVSKRKHQITYLAAEAKAREEELQNQWAANRHAKRQTMNKYGF
jgi:proline-rich protein PRCC